MKKIYSHKYYFIIKSYSESDKIDQSKIRKTDEKKIPITDKYFNSKK